MQDGPESAIESWIEKHTEDLADLTCRMVKIPSISGDEGRLAEFLQSWLTENGIDSELRTVPTEFQARFPNFASEPNLDARPNLYACLPGEGKSEAPIVVNGHLDVVPVGDASKWRFPPFSGTRSDGLIWGRGAADMKGPIAAALTALLALKECAPQLARDIHFHLVIGEETGGLGSLFAVSDQPRPHCAIVLEPSQARIVTAGAGSVQFTVRAKGKAAHGCAPWEGRSALKILLKCLEKIEAYAAQRNAELRHPLFEEYPQQAPLSIGTFASGEWRATVPESGEFSGRLGILPGERIDSVRRELELRIEQCRDELDIGVDDLCIDWPNDGFPSWETSPTEPLVEALGFAARRFEANVHQTGVMYGSDAGHYAASGVPVAIFGPGNIAVAHMVDEHIPEDQLTHAAKILAVALLKLARNE